MATFDFVVIIGGMCGFMMVIGGMLLLYKGAISLNQASKEEAVSLEFKKMLKITTHYPALGLFIIGLAFIIIAVSFSKSTRNQFTITGQVKVDDPDSLAVVIAIPRMEAKAYAGGRILASIVPQIDILEVSLACPGYKGVTIPIETKSSKWGAISLGEISLGRKEVEKPPINPENIVPVAGDLPPRSKQGAF